MFFFLDGFDSLTDTRVVFFPIYRAQTNLLQSLKYGKFNLTLRIQFSRKISIKESFANEKKNIFFRVNW